MMEQQPIYNPSIPFRGSIVNGLQDGKLIIIQGQVPEHARSCLLRMFCWQRDCHQLQMFFGGTLEMSIPFRGSIVNGLQDGKLIIIQGQVPEHARRFAVNFMCGSSEKPTSDIAFHFNMRYDQSAVVCNTLQCESWGCEERKEEIPIKVGVYFELMFKTQNHGFQVSVNGQHLLDYNHRLPLIRVDTLSIWGDVHVKTITFKNANEDTKKIG
ncbi:galectin-7-like [Hemitrygon akajei]|uniref:galectin-7-like n=1 Tax=Hemitrygon akajei TaxID=2704970 RepID=UPI003BF9BF66